MQLIKMDCMATHDSLDYCTTREAARILGVSVRTVQLWVENGTLDAWKTEGGHRRVSIASVERVRHTGKYRSGAPRTKEKINVLVVEDDNILLRLYRIRMESWGLPITVSTAHNGVEGLIMIGRVSPDLLITDLNMPELDGFTMVRTLVGSSLRDGMEIVVVTGLDEDEIAASGGLPKDIQVLPKPVPFGELKALCENILARRMALST